MNQQPEPVKQLMMLRNTVCIPDIPLPEGWVIRAMMPSEEADWVRICETASFFDDAVLSADERWMLEMGNDPTVRTENVFFACDASGMPVATATAKFISEEQLGRYPAVPNGLGYLHYVAALPECRGMGAGSAVSAAVLRRFYELGLGSCMLFTDDVRLTAIKSYLRLGWLPVLYTDGMRARWEKVLALLGWDGSTAAFDGYGGRAEPLFTA